MKWKSEKWSRSVVSDSLQPHGLQPTRLLHPWDFPGKSTGVSCHWLLHGLGVFLLKNIIAWTPGFLSSFYIQLPWTLKSLLQHHSSKASILRRSAFFTVQLSHPYMTTGKTIALTRLTLSAKWCLCFLIHKLSLSWRRQWQPTPVLLPGKSHGRRSLVGCSPWGCKESDMTEQLSLSLHCWDGKRTWNDWLILSRRAEKLAKGLAIALKIF